MMPAFVLSHEGKKVRHGPANTQKLVFLAAGKFENTNLISQALSTDDKTDLS